MSESDGFNITNFDFVLGAAALGRDRYLDTVARDELRVDHGGRVVPGVLAREVGVGDDRGTQLVVGM